MHKLISIAYNWQIKSPKNFLQIHVVPRLFFQNCSGKKVPNVPFLTFGNSQPDEYWWKSNFSNHTKSKLKVFNYSPEFYRQILFELAAWRHFVIDAQQMQHSFFYYSHFSLRWLPHCVKSVRILNYSGPYFPIFGLIWKNTEYLSVLSPNAGKWWPE